MKNNMTSHLLAIHFEWVPMPDAVTNREVEGTCPHMQLKSSGTLVWQCSVLPRDPLQGTGAHPPARWVSAADSSRLSPLSASKGATSYSWQPLPGKSASNEWSEGEYKGPTTSIRKFLKVIPLQSILAGYLCYTLLRPNPAFLTLLDVFLFLFCFFLKALTNQLPAYKTGSQNVSWETTRKQSEMHMSNILKFEDPEVGQGESYVTLRAGLNIQ